MLSMRLRRFLSIPSFLSFIMSGCWIFFNAFCMPIYMIVWFAFLTCICWITLIFKYKTTLYFWNDSYLVVTHNYLHMYCWIDLLIFCWVFCVCSFILYYLCWFRFKDIISFITWVRRCFLLFSERRMHRIQVIFV